MRKVNFRIKLNVIAFASAKACGRPFADSVCRQNGRMIERGRKKGGSSVRLVMLREDHLTFIIEFFSDDVRNPKPVFNPKRDRPDKRGKTERRISHVSLENTLILDKRFLIKSDKIKILYRNTPCFQAEMNGLMGKFKIMFFSCKSLLLGRGHDFSLLDQAGCRVMVKAGNS